MTAGVVYKVDRAIITIATEITEEAMIGLVHQIDRLSSEYFYKTIELRISSPGGTMHALDYYLDAVRRFGQRDLTIHTRALSQTGSAAAAMLSMGNGLREAGASSVLLYHFARVAPEGFVTARAAGELERSLTHTDRLMTWRIAARAFDGYGPAREHRESDSRHVRGPDDFSVADWRILRQLAGEEFRTHPELDEEGRTACLAAVRERVMSDCERHRDPSGFFALYHELFDIDAVMTAALACELRLIDRLVDDPDACPSTREPGRSIGTVRIPEWHPIFSPAGDIERAALSRHVMVFGETGSGKSKSAILPVLQAILRQANGVAEGHTPVSCALVIDPKKEILPVLQHKSPDGVGVRVLRTSRDGESLNLNLMLGEWSLEDDLAADDMTAAAHKVMLRCASFLPKNPAFETVLGRGRGDNAYWKNQGVRLAQTIIALLLILLKYRTTVFGADNLNSMAPHVKARLRAFGVVAGFFAPEVKEAGRAYVAFSKTVGALSTDWGRQARAARREARERIRRGRGEAPKPDRRRALFSVERRRELRSAWQVFAKRIRASQKDNEELREHIAAQRGEFAELLKSPKTRSLDDVMDEIKGTAESCWDFACPMLPDESIRPCRNFLSLAGVFQKRFFVGGSGRDSAEEDQLIVDDTAPAVTYNRQYERPKHYFLAHRLVEEYLRHLIAGRGIEDVFDETDYFHSLCTVRGDLQHYVGLFAFAKPTFADFSDSGPVQALFFGCEPFLTATSAAGQRAEAVNLFADTINSTNGGTIFVYQPSLGYGKDALVARALKAQFFETVLSDERRQKNGSEMPLVAYVADEFHRFITSDVVHGEQSFFDTCRSFGAFCVVASQSMSSLHHALAGESYTNKDEKAVEILLNNTGSKLFFRTTDGALHATIDRLCPTMPDLPKATQVRPPSSLRPGECYAVVADGRFLRCRIDLEAEY